MNEVEFQKLIQNSQPHQVFNLDWEIYYSLDFADTFLPQVVEYRGHSFHFFDGAELLSNIGNIVQHELELNEAKKIMSTVFYSYPKGVEAEKKKNNIQVEDSTVIAFIEVHQNDKIDISFRLGREFYTFLKIYAKENKLSKNSVSIQNKIYSSTITEFQKHFRDEISHFNMLHFIGKTIRIDLVKVHKKNAIKVQIDDIKVRISLSEKDFRVDFTTYNQVITSYSLQIFEGNALLYEKNDKVMPYSFINSVPGRNKTGVEQETGSYTAVWDCSANHIFEERSPKRKITFKITAITKDGKVASVTRKISLKEYIAKNKKPYNNTDFDKNRVVVWLKEDYTPKTEWLNNSIINPVKVYAGAKLIRLKPQRDSIYTPCLFWWNNAYHIQEFPEELLVDSNEVLTDFVGEVFQNDVVHTAHRSIFIEDSNEQLKELKQALSQKVNVQYKSVFLKSSLSKFKNQFRLDIDNKVETMNRLLSKVRDVYEPMDSNGGKIFDQIVFVPLSHDWFNKYNDDVKKRYNNYWINESGYNALQYESGGGEVFDDKETDPIMSDIIAEIISFTDLLDISNDRIMSEEWQWISYLQGLNIDNYRNLIMFSLDAWYSTEEESFASGIGLEQSFGIFKMPPFMTVMLHETSQIDSPSPIPQDSHTRDTENTWEKLSNDYSSFIDDEYMLICRIYIADNQISAVQLMTLINSIGI